MLLDDMCDFLTTGGMTSSIIFAGVSPPHGDTVVTVYETGGLPPVHTMGHGVGFVERPQVQVVSRASTYATARQNAQVAFQLLDGMPRRQINGTWYLYAEAVQSPFLIGRDAQERVQVAFNVNIIKEQS